MFHWPLLLSSLSRFFISSKYRSSIPDRNNSLSTLLCGMSACVLSVPQCCVTNDLTLATVAPSHFCFASPNIALFTFLFPFALTKVFNPLYCHNSSRLGASCKFELSNTPVCTMFINSSVVSSLNVDHSTRLCHCHHQ